MTGHIPAELAAELFWNDYMKGPPTMGLAELRTAMEKATKGPWTYGPGYLHRGRAWEYVIGTQENLSQFHANVNPHIASHIEKDGDAHFIALARNHFEQLLDIADAMRLLVRSGEFSSWLDEQTMPLGAAKELEQAEGYLRILEDKSGG